MPDTKYRELGSVLKRINKLVVGFIALIVSVVGFIELLRGKTGLVTIAALAIGSALILITLVHYSILFYKTLRRRASRSNKTFILIATFHRTEGVKDSDIHNEISQAIQESVVDLGLADIQVEVDPAVLPANDRSAAEALCKKEGASMIIWGSDTGVRITVNFLNMEEPGFFGADIRISETHRTQMALLSDYNAFVTADLPAELAFLSLLAIGRSLVTNHSYPAAVGVIEKAISHLPPGRQCQGLASAYFGLGFLFQVSTTNYDKAIASYNLSIELEPGNAAAFYNRGLVYDIRGDYEQAIDSYNWAIRLKPDYADAYMSRGVICNDMGDHKSSVEDYSRAIELKPDFVDAYVNRGLTYGRDKGDCDKAIEDFGKAIQLGSRDVEAYSARGLCYVAKKNYEKAVADFNQALKLKPDYAAVYFNRAQTYVGSGDYRKAIADYNHYVEFEPNSAPAYLDWLVKEVAYAKRDGRSCEWVVDGLKKVLEVIDEPTRKKLAEEALHRISH